MAVDVKRYSGGAILLHWLIAFLLAGELALGFAMPRDASGFELYQLHKSIGITILLLSFARLAWRFTHKRPAKLEGGLSGFLASAVHVLFYVIMIALPLTGWAIVSTAPINVPTVLFGVVPLPHLPLPGSINEGVEEVHELLAFAGLGLFALHVAGALRHHLLLRDSLLSRMGPGGSGTAVLALMVGVIALGLVVLFTVGGERPAEDAPEVAEEEVVLPPSTAQSEGRVPLDAADEGEDEGAGDEGTGEEEAGEQEDTAAESEAEEAEDAQPVAAGPPPQWTIQPGGSLRFTVDNGGATLNGSFARWSGDIAMDPANPETAEITIEVDLASASLGDATQDGMLKGPDFFGISANPAATWRATSVRSTGGNSYSADGTLSLKGASRPQAITFTLSGSGARRSVSGRATIDRNAFAVGVGDSAANLGANVSVSFTFEAVR